MMTHYIFKEGKANLAPVLLLHGTGGDEHQLVTLAELIAPGHPILSIRGRISEGGMNRYFRLKAPGFRQENFDLVSLAIESDWLAEEIKRLSEKHQLDSHHFIAIGYSNGANMALNMALNGKFSFSKMIAFHPMQIAKIEQADVVKTDFFLTNDPADPIVPRVWFDALVADIKQAGCQPEIFKSSYGHQLTEDEVNAAKNWLNQ